MENTEVTRLQVYLSKKITWFVKTKDSVKDEENISVSLPFL